MAAVQSPTTDRRFRYDLDDAELDALTQTLVTRYASELDLARSAGKDAMCFAVDAFDPIADLTRTTEQRVFTRLADNLPPEAMEREYGPYEDRSLCYVGLAVESRTVEAAMRIIVGNVGVGPTVKSIHDTLFHEEYREADSFGEIDLRDTVSDLEASDRNLELGIIGGHAEQSTPHGRRWVEEFHSMRAGSLLLDFATLVSCRTTSGRTFTHPWTSTMVAAALRTAHLLGAASGVTFITADVLARMRRYTGTPWVDLANRPPVRYIDGDTFDSQPSYVDLVRYRSELEAAFAQHERGRESERGPVHTGLARLVLAEDEDVRYVII